MRYCLFVILLIISKIAYCQDSDSIQHLQNIEFLYQLMLEQSEDKLSDLTEEVSDESYEDLLEDYLFYLENPVNINSKEAVQLEEIGLLNAFQIETLRQYQWQFGDLLILDELLMLDGFNETTVSVIGPLIYFGKNEKAEELEHPKIGTMLSKSKHQVTVNYAEKFGNMNDEDYLGSPWKTQLKYASHYKQKLRFGFAMEKDAGEPFFFNGINDSLRDLARQYRSPGFDFYGAHFYMTDIQLTRLKGHDLILKDVALGDYQLSFGQGLTLWSGMSFGKASGGSTAMKRASGIKPKTSSGEGFFFRGVASTLKYKDFNATLFYSFRHIDATIIETDSLDDAEIASALQETGYHRTLNELKKRNALFQHVLGGHLCYAGPSLEIGYTIYHLRLGTTLELKPSKYNQFYFQGDRLTNMGIDFRWLTSKAIFFGELSRNDNNAFAGLLGMTMKPKGYINFSILYRNYDKQYQNFFHGAFGESSRNQGEEGIYLSLQCAPAPRWDIIAYTDFFHLTWLTSQVYNPSWGHEYSLKVSHQINNKASMQLRIKSKAKMKNSTDDHVFSYYPVFYTKRSVNCQISYNINKSLVFSDKISYSHYFNDDGSDSRGYLLCHDIAFKPPEKPYSLTFRYALFDSDSYDSRINIYENDVLGAFSIPNLYGHGIRVYLLGKIKLFNSINIHARLGVSHLSQETKMDLKTEVIWKPFYSFGST